MLRYLIESRQKTQREVAAGTGFADSTIRRSRRLSPASESSASSRSKRGSVFQGQGRGFSEPEAPCMNRNWDPKGSFGAAPAMRIELRERAMIVSIPAARPTSALNRGWLVRQPIREATFGAPPVCHSFSHKSAQAAGLGRSVLPDADLEGQANTRVQCKLCRAILVTTCAANGSANGVRRTTVFSKKFARDRSVTRAGTSSYELFAGYR